MLTHNYCGSDIHKSESQNFLDPRFNKTLVKVKSRFQKDQGNIHNRTSIIQILALIFQI